MSKRLQVILDDQEFREIQKLARSLKMTVAEWVRQALRSAREGATSTSPEMKFGVVREAYGHSFPSGDIGSILTEIESEYGQEKDS